MVHRRPQKNSISNASENYKPKNERKKIMKTMRKALALIMVIAIVMSLGITAFATTSSGEFGTAKGDIVINNAPEGAAYKAYRIFDLSSFSGDNFSYSINADWNPAAVTAFKKAAKHYVSIADDGVVTLLTSKESDLQKDGAWAKAFSAVVKKFLTENSSNPSIKAEADPTVGIDNTHEGMKTYTWSGLEIGYYFIDTSVGSLCFLDTNHAKVEVSEKNELPSVTKTVKEGDSQVAASNTAVGTMAEFTITVTVVNGQEQYKITDTLSKGLRLDESTITISDDMSTDFGTLGYKTVTHNDPGDAADNDVFTVELHKAYTDALERRPATVTIKYKAMVTGAAIVKGDANTMTNGVTLEYGDDYSIESTDKPVTTTYNYNIDIVKYTQDGEQNVRLNGAKFNLYDAATNGNKYNFVGTAGKYTICTDSSCVHESHAEKLETDAQGNLLLQGLDEGTYYLEETDAPEGYNKLSARTEIVINEKSGAEDQVINGVVKNGEASITLKKGEGTEDVTAIGIENKSGNELPETGGIGTTIFYTVGGVLMVTALALFITKKKMAAN